MPVTPTVTAVRAAGRRVAVELDGRPWRTVPLEAAVAARLSPGVGLDRERAREPRARPPPASRRGRRPAGGRPAGAHARDASRSAWNAPESRRRGEARCSSGPSGPASSTTVATRRPGRGISPTAEPGDELVVDDLVRHGVDEVLAREAVAALEPERDRAARIVVARGLSPRTARFLAAKGFAAELVEDVVAELESRALP